MSAPKMIVIEVDLDGIRAVYADDQDIRVVLVDHCWDDEAHVTCPVRFPSRLEKCPDNVRTAAEMVVVNTIAH